MALLLLMEALAFSRLLVVCILANLISDAPCLGPGRAGGRRSASRDVSSVLDRLGIQPGEQVLESRPQPGVFTLETA